MNINTEKLFFFDIETSGRYSTYQEFKNKDPRGAELFHKKFLKKKDSNETWKEINEAYLRNSTLISEYGQIICLSMGYFKDGKLMISSIGIGNENIQDEKELMTSAQKYFDKISKLGMTLSGYNIKNFDMPWLFRKFCQHGLKVPDCINIAGKKPWEINVLDTMEIWKGSAFEYTTLDEVLYTMGIESPKEGPVAGHNMQEYFWNVHNITEIISYCERDIKTTAELTKKLAELL